MQVPTIFNELRTHEAPPTFFQTNKITAVFQDIVEAYGVARYREVSSLLLTPLHTILSSSIGSADLELDTR